MNEMVERVARALWDDRYPEDEWSPTDRRDFMGHARAALEAMREPTIEMIQAGLGFQGIHVCYRNMIDRALGGETVDSDK